MTKIFAHRGASGYAPENTLEAFALAETMGADGIELDVQLSKDGELVVTHDESVERISGEQGFVKDYTSEELKRFSIPTLKEVLTMVKPGMMQVNIELKTGIFWYPQIEEKTLALVKKMKMQERVIYSSFNHYSIRKIRELDADAETAILYSDVLLDVEQYAEREGIAGLHPSGYHFRMADFAEKYYNSRLKVRVWTVNEEEDMRTLIANGVEAVITNYPDKALAIRTEFVSKV